MSRKPLYLALVAAFAVPAVLAAPAPTPADPSQLDEIVVKAAPLEPSAAEVIDAVTVLTGEALERRRASTLGATLDGLPGVANTAFGPGAGRPIIRGQDGARVQVLLDGMASHDVAALSPDHAVGIDPAHARQVEVLKGPATLIYGSGAIGGIVNVDSGRLPLAPREAGVRGQVEMRGDSVADLRQGQGRLEIAGANGWSFGADFARLNSDDYEINGFPIVGDEEPEEFGKVENTSVETDSAGAHLGWAGEAGAFGVAFTRYESLYGIPKVEGEEEEEDGADALSPKSLAKGAGEKVRIDLEQDRIDVHGALFSPFAGVEELKLRAALTDYSHVELEGDEIGTLFDNDERDLRLSLKHAPWGDFTGLIGIAFNDREVSAVGEEAFIPPSEVQSRALFWVEHAHAGNWHLDLGARAERTDVDALGEASRDFSLFSVSAGLGWTPIDGHRFTIALDRAQRAPAPEELYADGPHAATQAFEIGDADLQRETATQAELGWRYTDDTWLVAANVYSVRYRDFIYLQGTDEVEDDLPVFLWTQADARFSGFEAEAGYQLPTTALGDFGLRFSADSVQARLSEGGALPRIPPRRYGLTLDWSQGAWSGAVGARHHVRQDDISAQESETAGFTLFEADLAWTQDLGNGEFTAWLKGRNLGDKLARVHTSFLKEVAPLPGRNVEIGVRYAF
ncbi:MAG: TonB-dependent receptor [Xanthomonadales bacterium]|jgi:iron complex outermembrane receptor protein|nr:TonB-dependent receptor [Xanthomonadales bacterium]